MDTRENNKLIAEFMGAVCEMVDHTEGNEDFCKSEGIDKWLIPTWSKPEGYNEDKWGWGKYRMGYFEYHESWDWLMPVVEKIETLEIKMPEKNKTGFERNTEFANISITTSYDNRAEFLGWSYWVDLGTKTIIDYDKRKSSKLNATYEAVIRTIQWCNENNK